MRAWFEGRAGGKGNEKPNYAFPTYIRFGKLWLVFVCLPLEIQLVSQLQPVNQIARLQNPELPYFFVKWAKE